MNKILLLFLVFTGLTVSASQAAPIPQDRWLEADLYWFEKGKMKESSDHFWKRMAPLFDEVGGERGVILNIGWIMDFVLGWNGDMTERIPLPRNMGVESQFRDQGLLLGTTRQRKEQAADRFAHRAEAPYKVEYEPWRYDELKTFIRIFKASAARHGVKDIKVGTFVIGWGSAYKGEVARFADRHPGAFEISPALRSVYAAYLSRIFNPTYRMTADSTRYGAYPDGVEEGTPVTEFFGNQWGDLSVKLGLDVIVLRDSALGQAIYLRSGPAGQTAPANPDEVRRWSDAYASLVRATKRANPQALVIGYSSGASAVADWRVNCLDLEAIAKEGSLDAFIDQTWSGAWNEVGNRAGFRFWNNPMLGWTYQLGNVLLHGAMLAGTPCKHYILTETFDAWESWNIVGTVPQRLRWGIWAYSHAGVKRPSGLKFPDGSYISWANQAKRLLSEPEVEFLASETNAAFRDLEQVTDLCGPTLVYARSAMEWQNVNHPSEMIKEWIDEQAGTLMKWSVPILSAARIEELEGVKSDLFILQTPVNLQPAERKTIDRLLGSGSPVVIVGSPAGGIAPEICRRYGFSGTVSGDRRVEYRGSLGGRADSLTEGCPNSFLTYQFYSKNKVAPGKGTQVLYSVAESPALVRNGNVTIWDAPELLKNLPSGSRGEGMPSLDEMIGSPVPYVVLARSVTGDLLRGGRFCARFDAIENPVWCGAWTTRDGGLSVLAGELEEGLDHSGRGIASFTLHFPASMNGRCLVREHWSGERYVTPGPGMPYLLRKGESKILKIEKL